MPLLLFSRLVLDNELIDKTTATEKGARSECDEKRRRGSLFTRGSLKTRQLCRVGSGLLARPLSALVQHRVFLHLRHPQRTLCVVFMCDYYRVSSHPFSHIRAVRSVFRAPRSSNPHSVDYVLCVLLL